MGLSPHYQRYSMVSNYSFHSEWETKVGVVIVTTLVNLMFLSSVP